MKGLGLIILCLIIIAVIALIFYGGNYLYNLGLNPKFPKDLKIMIQIINPLKLIKMRQVALKA